MKLCSASWSVCLFSLFRHIKSVNEDLFFWWIFLQKKRVIFLYEDFILCSIYTIADKILSYIILSCSFSLITLYLLLYIVYNNFAGCSGKDTEGCLPVLKKKKRLKNTGSDEFTKKGKSVGSVAKAHGICHVTVTADHCRSWGSGGPVIFPSLSYKSSNKVFSDVQQQ